MSNQTILFAVQKLFSAEQHVFCELLGYKKLSYHRETARQLPTWRGGLGPPAHSLDASSGYIYMRLVEFETHNKRTAVH